MSKWFVILNELKTDDDRAMNALKRSIKASGGQILWEGEDRPLVQVQAAEKQFALESDPRRSKPI